MLKTFKLLLPALIPAWNFFDWIAPSPRIEYALQNLAEEAVQEWREFRPRPSSISFRATAARLFFNPQWNETLFLVSCAERIAQAPAEAPDDHSVREIFDRIHADLIRTAHAPCPARFLRFRIASERRRDDAVVREIIFVSPPRQLNPVIAA
jgi:hypothetical protein